MVKNLKVEHLMFFLTTKLNELCLELCFWLIKSFSESNLVIRIILNTYIRNLRHTK